MSMKRTLIFLRDLSSNSYNIMDSVQYRRHLKFQISKLDKYYFQSKGTKFKDITYTLSLVS